MSFFRLHAWVIRRIDSIRRSFLWKGNRQAHGSSSLINWRLVCTPKDKGGWGVLNLRKFNTALLARWCWSIFSNPQPLWVSLVSHNYYSRNRLWDINLPRGRRCSHFWRGVIMSAPSVLQNIRPILGNGELILFWSDAWCTDAPFQVLYPSLFEITSDKAASVASMFRGNEWHLSFLCSLSLPRLRALQSLLGTLEHISTTPGSDRAVWKLTGSGVFSVSSLYHHFFESQTSNKMAASIWKVKAPLKVRITLWLGIHNKLLTADILAARNIAPLFNCVFCGSCVETADHMFLTCPPIRGMWNSLMSHFRLRQNPDSLAVLWSSWKRRWISARMVKEWETTVATVIWVLWSVRNEHIFEGRLIDLDSARANIIHLAKDWG